MFAIASISKTFTAAEVMVQAAAGTIDLDAPLSNYVGQELAPNGATVRQALGMRSGLPDFTATEADRLQRAQNMSCSTHWTPRRTVSYATTPASKPNTHTEYSNPNYLLLGLALRHATGSEPARLYRSDLFMPAGLDRIAAQDLQVPSAPVAAPPRIIHRASRDLYIPCRALASGGGNTMVGIAADAPTVARWAYELYGARFLPLPTVKAMVTPLSDEDILPNIKYGLGTECFHVAFGTDDSFGHGGLQPGYTTLVAVIPARHLAAAVLIADDNKDTFAIMKGILDQMR